MYIFVKSSGPFIMFFFVSALFVTLDSLVILSWNFPSHLRSSLRPNFNVDIYFYFQLESKLVWWWNLKMETNSLWFMMKIYNCKIDFIIFENSSSYRFITKFIKYHSSNKKCHVFQTIFHLNLNRKLFRNMWCKFFGFFLLYFLFNLIEKKWIKKEFLVDLSSSLSGLTIGVFFFFSLIFLFPP